MTFSLIKYYYETGVASLDEMRRYVDEGYISAEEFYEITRKVFDTKEVL